MLIVDDEPDICDCLGHFFQAKGFAVSCAFTGEDAIEWLMQQPADILLLDIRLPGVWGIEVLKQAKQLYPDIKVVMVTALDADERRIEARAYGACGYVTKPFDFSDRTWAPVFTDPS